MSTVTIPTSTTTTITHHQSYHQSHRQSHHHLYHKHLTWTMITKKTQTMVYHCLGLTMPPIMTTAATQHQTATYVSFLPFLHVLLLLITICIGIINDDNNGPLVSFSFFLCLNVFFLPFSLLY